MLNIRLLFEINIHYISIYQPTYPFKQSFAFFSGLHCDAVWTNSWWHFHAGLQLPAVCCAGLCHRALQLWWQNRLWITERSPFVYSHWNQNATRPRSNQNNLWLHLQRFLWWAPITNDGPLNVTIPAAALSPPWACDSLQDWETKLVSYYHLILHGTGESWFLSRSQTHICSKDSIDWRVMGFVWHLNDEGVLTSLKDVKLCFGFVVLYCIVLLCIGLYLRYQ